MIGGGGSSGLVVAVGGSLGRARGTIGESLRLEYPTNKSESLRFRINDRRATLPVNVLTPLASVVITNDNYEQFLR